MDEYDVKLVNFMQIFISLSGTSLSDLNEHAFVTKLMMMLSSFDYVEIGFLSFSTDLMGKCVVAVFLLTLLTIFLSPPLLVFVGFNFFHLCLSIVFLYFVLLFVSPPFGICRIHLAPHSVNHSNTSSAITFVFKHFSAPFPFSHSQIYWLL